MTDRKRSVIKVGGSVLRDRESYVKVSRALADRIRRGPTWTIVSAAHGVTDALDRLSRTADPDAAQSLLARQADLGGTARAGHLKEDLWRGVLEARVGLPDRLLSWGERASAAALEEHLSDLGVSVTIEELSTCAPRSTDRSAIVPGFYVRDRSGRVRVLPRGGSDITAVIVASRVGARSVQLWKDGGGIHEDGRSVREVTAGDLLPRLCGTIRPLHPAALLLAARRGIDLILEDPFGAHGPTRVVATERARLPAVSRPPGVPGASAAPLTSVPRGGTR